MSHSFAEGSGAKIPELINYFKTKYLNNDFLTGMGQHLHSEYREISDCEPWRCKHLLYTHYPSPICTVHIEEIPVRCEHLM